MTHNRTHSRLVALALIACLLALPLCGLADAFRTVRGGGLNLRETPSLTAKVLGQYKTGTWVEVLEAGEEFSKVKVAGKTGYMMNKFLSDGTSSLTLYVRTNTGIGLNLRSAPSTSANILGSYKIDTAVSVLQKGNGWYRVSVGGQEGYMSAQFLKSAKAPAYTAPVTPHTAKLYNPNGGSIVNFRLYPGMNTKILAAHPVGTEVTVLEKGVNWSLVQIGDAQGYVSSYFLK